LTLWQCMCMKQKTATTQSVTSPTYSQSYNTLRT